MTDCICHKTVVGKDLCPVHGESRVFAPTHEIQRLLRAGNLTYHVGRKKADARDGKSRIFDTGSMSSMPNLFPSELLAIEIPETIVIMDVDNADHVKHISPIPPTLTVTTPNGVHFYFRLPIGLILPGVISLFGTPKIGGISVEHKHRAAALSEKPLERSIDLLVHESGFAIVPPTEGYKIAEALSPVLMPTTMITAVCEVLAQLDDLDRLTSHLHYEVFRPEGRPF